MPSSEKLFSTLSYVLFAAPAAVVTMWMAWRIVAWCLFHAARAIFPGRAGEPGTAPRLFARSGSRALSYTFLFFLLLPLIYVPLRSLADRLEGPQILMWHWILVLGPLSVLVVCLVALIRRKED